MSSHTKRRGNEGNTLHEKSQEGKNKMSVINADRNKLIHRVFAVVRDEKSVRITIPKHVHNTTEKITEKELVLVIENYWQYSCYGQAVEFKRFQ